MAAAVVFVAVVLAGVAFRPLLEQVRSFLFPVKTLSPEEEKRFMMGSSMYENGMMNLSFVIPHGSMVEEKNGAVRITERAEKEKPARVASPSAASVVITAISWPEKDPITQYVENKEPFRKTANMKVKGHSTRPFGYFTGDIFTYEKARETATVVYFRKRNTIYRVDLGRQSSDKGTYAYSILSGMRYMDVIIP